MEGPVMTSASSHRLRSAVSACAQPTHSYFNTSYLSINIQPESGNYGDCNLKFHCFGKSGKSSLLDKLNTTSKVDASHDILFSSKRDIIYNKSCLTHLCGSKTQCDTKNCYENEVENSFDNEVLNVNSRQFMIGNHFLSKLKLSRNILNAKRLESYFTNVPFKGIIKKCAKVITNNKILNYNCNSKHNNFLNKNNGHGSCNNNNKKIKNSDRCICSRIANTRILNCYTTKYKIKSNKSKVNVLFFEKNIGIDKERSDQCYVSDVRDRGKPLENRNLKQELWIWQPKHVVTRRTAQIVREIQNAWKNRFGSSKLVPAENVQLLFNDLQLLLSSHQVEEMLKCAQECSEKATSRHLTFGDFYNFAHNLINTKIVSTPSSTDVFKKNVEKRRRKFSRGMSKYEVFLGGSCNPTTWRTDFAIPELENMKISYYNPQQVEEWRPELLEVEYQAKENATVMFFVIDNQTRGVSALIEVAHLAGNRRKLVLVIQSFTQENQIICDEKITQNEFEDLKAGQEVLQFLVESQRIPVFEDIKEALKITKNILREDLTADDLPLTSIGSEITLSPLEVFEKLKPGMTGEIFAREACLAFKLLYRHNVSLKILETINKRLGIAMNGSKLDVTKIDFETFKKVIADYEKEVLGENYLESSFPRSSSDSVFDIYLGGTLENTQWRETIAIPMLMSQNLSYFIPKVNGGREQFSDVEAAAIESSFVVLFVITKTARSAAAMAIAGHYIGRGANVVLCVQHLSEDTILDNEALTKCAIKDYNRGRMYLMDIAKRTGISVFEEISEAVEFAMRKCGDNNADENNV